MADIRWDPDGPPVPRLGNGVGLPVGADVNRVAGDVPQVRERYRERVEERLGRRDSSVAVRGRRTKDLLLELSVVGDHRVPVGVRWTQGTGTVHLAGCSAMRRRRDG